MDALANKANSANSVFTGTTSINGPDLLNGPVAFGSSITGIDITDVSGLQSSLGQKAPLASPSFTGTVDGITKSMRGLGNVDNTADIDKPNSKDVELAYKIRLEMIVAKANKASPTFSGTVSGITKAMVGLGNADSTTDLNKPISIATQTALDSKADKLTTYTKTDVDTDISNRSSPRGLEHA